MRRKRRPDLQVFLSPRLPGNERDNGLARISQDLRDGETAYVIMTVSLASSQTDHRTGATTLYAGIERIEGVPGFEGELRALFEQLTIERCGRPEPTLPGLGEL